MKVNAATGESMTPSTLYSLAKFCKNKQNKPPNYWRINTEIYSLNPPTPCYPPEKYFKNLRKMM